MVRHGFISWTTCVLADGGIGGVSGTQLAMLGLAVIALTVVVRSTLRRVTRVRSQPRPSARALYSGMEKTGEVTRDVEQVMIELDQLARQIHGRIDTRFAKLEAVIRDADERIDRLSRLVRETDGSPACDVTLDRQDPHAPPEPDPGVSDERYAAVYRLADGGLSATEIASEVGKTAGEVELILALRKVRDRAGRSADLTTSSPRS